MNQCVAFGAMFPDTPDFMHQANERWELSKDVQSDANLRRSGLSLVWEVNQ